MSGVTTVVKGLEAIKQQLIAGAGLTCPETHRKTCAAVHIGSLVQHMHAHNLVAKGSEDPLSGYSLAEILDLVENIPLPSLWDGPTSYHGHGSRTSCQPHPGSCKWSSFTATLLDQLKRDPAIHAGLKLFDIESPLPESIPSRGL